MLTMMLLAFGVGAQLFHLQRENMQLDPREYPRGDVNQHYEQQGAPPQTYPQQQPYYSYRERQQQPYFAPQAGFNGDDEFAPNERNEEDTFAADERRKDGARAAKALLLNVAAQWQQDASFSPTQQLGSPFPGALQPNGAPRFDSRPFPPAAADGAAASGRGRVEEGKAVADTPKSGKWERYGHCLGANQSPVNLPSVATEWPSSTNNFDRHFVFNKQKPKDATLVNDGHVYAISLRPSTANPHNSAQVQTREQQQPQRQVDTEALANLMLPPGGRDDTETFGLAVIPSHEVHLYRVTAIRMHFPSEHAVHGQLFGGEIHLLMTRADGKQLSVGVFVDRRATKQDPRQDSLEAFLPGLHMAPEVGSHVAVKVNLHALHRVLQGPFWRYTGSSTVPPCEPTDWLMFQFALGVRADTLDMLTRALPRANRRPLQASDGREFTVNAIGSHESSASALGSVALFATLCWWF